MSCGDRAVERVVLAAAGVGVGPGDGLAGGGAGLDAGPEARHGSPRGSPRRARGRGPPSRVPPAADVQRPVGDPRRRAGPDAHAADARSSHASGSLVERDAVQPDPVARRARRPSCGRPCRASRRRQRRARRPSPCRRRWRSAAGSRAWCAGAARGTSTRAGGGGAARRRRAWRGPRRRGGRAPRPPAHAVRAERALADRDPAAPAARAGQRLLDRVRRRRPRRRTSVHQTEPVGGPPGALVDGVAHPDAARALGVDGAQVVGLVVALAGRDVREARLGHRRRPSRQPRHSQYG